MKIFAKYAAAAAVILSVSSVSAMAACDGDASTETVLGAGTGALAGGLASHSVAGAAIGGIAGGLIGNSIGHANNREDCHREAEYYRERDYAYNPPPPDYVDRNGNRYYDDDYP